MLRCDTGLTLEHPAIKFELFRGSPLGDPNFWPEGRTDGELTQYTAGESMVNRPKSAVLRHLSIEVNRHFYVSPRSSEGLVWTARGSSGVLMADSGSFPEVCARFGRFQLDLSSRELFCLGNRVAIQDKPLQILRLLLEANGQVVSREQIRSALWPQDTFVDFEHGVNTAVKKLRQALEDSAERPEFVETLPRVGYRFLVPVEWVEDGNGFRKAPNVVVMPAPESLPGPRMILDPKPKHRRWKPLPSVALASFVVIIAAISVLFRNGYLSPSRIGITGQGNGRRTTEAHPPSSTRLTANPQDTPVTSASISPDGKYLAYTDATGFYLRLVDTGETHPVRFTDGFTPSVEGWFPDSVHLVVSWVDEPLQPPSLWEISVLGGTPQKLSDTGCFGRVSPDGSQIAFLKGPWDNSEIWLVGADGNGARKIVDAGLDNFGPVAWSPDGTRLAWVRQSVERPGGQIEIYNTASGHSETILSFPNLGAEITWSRSGKLYYSLAEAAPNRDDSNLWSVQLDSHTGHPSGSPIRITDDRDRASSITVTTDGKRLAVLRYSFQTDVYLATIEANGKTLSAPRRFTLDQRNDFPSSWTPDSKAVLIVSDRDGVSHIFKQNVQKTQPELLVGGKQDVWLPHMTPDGRDVLYLSSPEQVGPSDKVRLMSISLSGGPSHQILEEPGLVNYQCALLPARICIYGQIESESYRFFVFDPASGKHTALPVKMKKGSAMNNWNLSPDGRNLAIAETQNPYEGPRLRIISLADNSERLLSLTLPKLIMGVDWAADSRSLWAGGYMGRGSWGTRSGLVNVDLRGHLSKVIEGSTPIIWGGTPSPDGRSLALGANSFSANVWLLNNPQE